jgi:hypothetical protein
MATQEDLLEGGELQQLENKNMEVDPEPQDDSLQLTAEVNPDHYLEEEAKIDTFGAPATAKEQGSQSRASEKAQILKVQQEIEDLKETILKKLAAKEREQEQMELAKLNEFMMLKNQLVSQGFLADERSFGQNEYESKRPYNSNIQIAVPL